MLRFIDDSYDLTQAYPASYDFTLVLISYLVACLAAYTAWTMADNLQSQHGHKRLWHAGGSFAMGCGIWCMHFVGMMAFQLPLQVAYDPWITMGSMFPAILASWVAIDQFGQTRMQLNKVAVSAVFIGAGVGAMHYIGMAAMRVEAVMAYDVGLFILSIIVAVVLAFIALAVKYLYGKMALNSRRNWYKLCSVMIMGLAISGMHYTAMAAVLFFPGNQVMKPSQALPITSLSLMVIFFTVLILVLTLIATVFELRLRKLSVNLDTSQKRMLDAIESISEGFVMFDKVDRMVMANSVYYGMYTELKDKLIPGVNYQELVQEKAARQYDDIQYVDKKMAWHQGSDHPFEEAVSDGRKFIGRECRSSSGDLIGVWSDISKIKNVQDKLAAQKAQLRQVLDISPVAIFILEVASDEIKYANRASYKLKQRLQQHMHGDAMREFQRSDGYRQVKAHAVECGAIYNHEVNMAISENFVSLLVSAATVEFDNKACLLYSLIDISERKAAEEQLRLMAATDPLTQLYNRRHFMERTREHVSRCLRNQLPLSIFMLDIDYFKHVNDTYGHATGDEVIKSVALCIKKQLRDGDIVGRLGGDEFVVVLADKDQNSAFLVAERIRKAVDDLSFDNHIGGVFSISISVGISSLNRRKTDEAVLLVEADKALYEAKKSGRNQCCNYRAE